MAALTQRLSKLEATSGTAKPGIVFLWESSADDAALAEAKERARREGRIIFVNWITDPPNPKETA